MRTALLIVDMQNAFFEDPSLSEGRAELVGACNRLIAAARAGGSPALITRTEHERDRSTWTLSMLDDEQGFAFRGTAQAAALPELDTEGLPELVKHRDSAFVGTDLVTRLTTWGAERLLLAGVSTHSCVAQTAADAYAHNFRVAFVEGAMGASTPDHAQSMLDVLSAEYRQDTLDVDTAVELLKGGQAA
ncbi:nicotinamidase [Sinomonas cellulolyticus]|uniref:Cysteine hydrolase n=1 Tax=Sinomonas cellulolyticus TaxID=2801916 RepID=A0ABS1K0T8_9MICC|nr:MULTISPECIES: isochorismatase family cysteine hydrolase [Sinomonas]MBL0705144.1 cysteine hydrolase [Sinomonas cellulolyticus]GHG39513.1 nicotinamidase [Sinomonas sp. KCTC 49339]